MVVTIGGPRVATSNPVVEVRSPPSAKWPLVVYLDGMAVKIIHETGVVQDVDTRAQSGGQPVVTWP